MNTKTHQSAIAKVRSNTEQREVIQALQAAQADLVAADIVSAIWSLSEAWALVDQMVTADEIVAIARRLQALVTGPSAIAEAADAIEGMN